MIENLAERMNLAAELHDWVEENGCEVVRIGFRGYDDRHVELQINLKDDLQTGLNRWGDNDNETAAALVLDADKSLTLRRSCGLIYVDGERYGLKFELYFGRGVCEEACA